MVEKYKINFNFLKIVDYTYNFILNFNLLKKQRLKQFYSLIHI